MVRHLSSEQLSAYLDGEAAFHESREIEGHLAACANCRDRFKSMQRTVSGVWHLDRVAPPPGLSTRVRAEVAAVSRPEPNFVRTLGAFIFGLPNQRAVPTVAAIALPLVLSLFLFKNGMEEKAALEPNLMPRPNLVEVVTVGAVADLPLDHSPQTTSKVAGRDFVWRESGRGDVWVQKGLEGRCPSSVSAQSPQGASSWHGTRTSACCWLMVPGRAAYRLETVELSQGV